MARPSAQLLHAIQICVLALLGLCLSLTIAYATPNDPNQLIHQGFSQYNSGQFPSALQTWQQAEQRYRQQGDVVGISGALINQSLAHQAIGQHRPACYAAAKAIQLDQKICVTESLEALPVPSSISTAELGLKALGDSLNGLGYWESAESVLKQALSQENRAVLWQSLGETYTQSGRNSDAIKAYQTAARLASNSQQWEVLADVKIALWKFETPTEADLRAIDLSVFPGLLKAQARLKIAHYTQAAKPHIALQQAQEAYSIATQFQHSRSQAEALLLIGQARQQLRRSDFDSLQKSAALAQSIRAWDIAYLAHGSLAAIYQEAGQLDHAKTYYQSAVNNLNRLRQTLKGNNSRLQAEFYQSVKPIYQNYLELLFQDSNQISEIIKISTALQVAELENFLGCQLEDWQQLSQLQQTDNTSLIYIIRGIKSYQVIIRTPNQPDYTYLVDAESLDKATYNFSVNIRSGNLYALPSKVVKTYGKNLYDIFLKPALGHLPQTGTLAFILDPSLQDMPFDFLYDGEYYLTQNYSFSLALGGQIRQPKLLDRKNFKVLLAGVSNIAPSFDTEFSQLIGVDAEFRQIAAILRSKVLLNQDFTIKKFQELLENQDYPIIHLASHGKFSSNPRENGIFAWDKQLDMYTLRQLIDRQSKQRNSIELLVLSACETAKGDQRSVLGLAGVAAQAGARSTVASLWLVNEESTVALMSEFYQGLKNGLSKAEALRQAKLTLINSSDFNHPFFWGSFQLIGSWQ